MSARDLPAGPLGFVGLGVMGAPMSANVAAKTDRPILVFDVDADRLREHCPGGALAADLATIARECAVVFMSLPNGAAVEQVVAGPGGLLESARPGLIVVDMSTSPVPLVQRLAEALAERGAVFVDAPVTRTQAAAVAGTLSVTVGCADRSDFELIDPLLRHMATDVTFCGSPGAGALAKLLNNTIVFESVVALAEAVTVARRSGLIDDAVLFDVLSQGSAGSFALENHGKLSLLPDTHPGGKFSARYMLKDLSYTLDFAHELGVAARLGELAADRLEKTIELGYGDRYHTAVVRVVEHESARTDDAATPVYGREN